MITDEQITRLDDLAGRWLKFSKGNGHIKGVDRYGENDLIMIFIQDNHTRIQICDFPTVLSVRYFYGITYEFSKDIINGKFDEFLDKAEKELNNQTPKKIAKEEAYKYN